MSRARTWLAGAIVAVVCVAGLWTGWRVNGEQPAKKATADAVHDPANAVANLDVYPGLQATLFASEPLITNPTNLDVDARGRCCRGSS